MPSPGFSCISLHQLWPRYIFVLYNVFHEARPVDGVKAVEMIVNNRVRYTSV